MRSAATTDVPPSREHDAAPSLPNFRDAGGLPIRDGGRLAEGRVYRSELPARLGTEDRAALAPLGIGLVVDLRTVRERRRRGAATIAGVRRAWRPLHEDPRYDAGLRDLGRFLLGRDGEARFRAFVERYYRHLLETRAAQLGRVLSLVAEERGASWIHCTAGRDRTGLVIAFLQGALGVPERELIEHFRETDERYGARLTRLAGALRVVTLGTVPDERMRVVLRTQPEILAALLRERAAQHGSLEGYVREGCGVSEADLRRLRVALIEPTTNGAR